jgi:secondary thiamine-phosphate synthase enzyme
MKNVPIVRETISTHSRNEMVSVTRRVQQAVTDAGVTSGMAVVFVPHTTAACTINENADPDVQHDLLRKLGELVPKAEPYYEHGEGNSDAHVKTSTVGASVTVLVEGGKLMLGRWQGIYVCEFDGPRERQVWIKVVGFDGAG